jgi:hypothetical protein
LSILRGYSGTLAATFMVDETAVDAGDVTVTVTNQAGTTVASGVATSVSTGVYTFPIAAQTVLGTLTVVWSGASLSQTTQVDVVGAVLFNLPDLRAADRAFADTAKFPTAALSAARDAVTDEFARICGRSFVPRGDTYATMLDNTGFLLLPSVDVTRLVAVTIDGVAQDVTTLQLDPIGTVKGLPSLQAATLSQFWDGAIGSGSPGTGLTVVTFEYGFAYVPNDLYRAAVQRARFILASIASGIPDRATSFVAAEGGSFTLATPGSGVWQTGIPDVDAVLARYTIAPKGVIAI